MEKEPLRDWIHYLKHRKFKFNKKRYTLARQGVIRLPLSFEKMWLLLTLILFLQIAQAQFWNR
jgi:hypothetical protein